MELTSEIYARQNKIEGLNIIETASIVGLGGTGFWTALFLAMSGTQNLILIDDDITEVSNLNRLPLSKEHIGTRKVYVVRDFILNLRKDIRIEIHTDKIITDSDCGKLRGYIFCCTDNLKSQQLICAYAKNNNIPYQRIGYDGTILNVSKAFPLSFEEETTTGYTQTPSWVIPAALAGALGVASKMYKEVCVMEDLGKICIKESSYIPEKIKKTLAEKYKDIYIEEGRESILDNIYAYIPDEYGYCGECSMLEDARYVSHEEGYHEGHIAGREEGYHEGHIAGRDEGYNEGHSEGREEGYSEGYKKGLAESRQ